MKALPLALLVLLAAPPLAAQQTETIAFESRQKGKPVQVTAEITWPAGASTAPLPALVIHHGSGGVSSRREGRFAREIVAMGVAAVVIDSFKPRGVTSTVQDQSAVTGADFNFDALMALKALGTHPRIDAKRIGIVGFSKGGTSALMAAHERLATAAGLPAGLRYALHVPFYPSCTTQYWKPVTSGAPILMLLGASDTYVGYEPCQTYGEALKANGARVDVTVYPGAMHGFDGGAPYFDPRGENYAKCVVQQQADGSWIERSSGVTTNTTTGAPVPGALAKAFGACKVLGTSGGGQDEAARLSMDALRSHVRTYLLKN